MCCHLCDGVGFGLGVWRIVAIEVVGATGGVRGVGSVGDSGPGGRA